MAAAESAVWVQGAPGLVVAVVEVGAVEVEVGADVVAWPPVVVVEGEADGVLEHPASTAALRTTHTRTPMPARLVPIPTPPVATRAPRNVVRRGPAQVLLQG
jgi:hypothetical protein